MAGEAYSHIHCSLENVKTVKNETKAKELDTFGKYIALKERSVLQDKDKQVFNHIY